MLCASCSCIGEAAVHPDALDADRWTERILKSSGVDDLLRIEEYEIGVVSLMNQSTLCDAESLRGHAGHLVDSFGKREQFFFTAVATKHPGECSPEARMRARIIG